MEHAMRTSGKTAGIITTIGIDLVRRPRVAMRGLWPWIEQASKRLHRNMLAIALANKLARIAWAVLARGRAYQPRISADAACSGPPRGCPPPLSATITRHTGRASDGGSEGMASRNSSDVNHQNGDGVV